MRHVDSKCDYTNRMVCNMLVTGLGCFKMHCRAGTRRDAKEPLKVVGLKPLGDLGRVPAEQQD